MTRVLSSVSKRIRPVGLVVLLLCVGCVRHAASPAGVDPRMEAEPDSLRGRDFAQLIVPGDTASMPGLGLSAFNPRVPIELLQKGPATAYIAVIVDSTGWVEPASRTVLGSTGDPRVVKMVCDFLATATFEWHGSTPRRTFTFLPAVFFVVDGPRGEAAQAASLRETLTDPKVLLAQLRTLTFEQRRQWFADQQPCASLHAK